jgi:uncharacterized protein (DUF58 family)
VRGLRGRRVDEGRARRRWVATSGTFVGHRHYAVGEDLRRLDWNAYARSGELHVKVLEEEQRRVVTVLLDTSASMLAGDPERFFGARRFCAVVVAAALARLDAVHLATTSGTVHLSGAAGVERALAFLEQLSAAGGKSDELARLAAPGAGLRGRICWLSDFAELDEVEAALRILKPRRRDVLAILPSTVEDVLPRVDGYVELRDPERGEWERVRVDAALRAGMEQELGRLRRRRAAAFAETGIRLIELRLPEQDDHRPEPWLAGGWATWI